MRALPIFSCLWTLALGLATTADVRAESVEDTTETPHLTVFGEEQEGLDVDRPSVLRGSAIPRGTAGGGSEGPYQTPGFQIGAGAKLWLVDPVSGTVLVCDERRTSRVGSAFIGCLEDQLPYPISQ